MNFHQSFKKGNILTPDNQKTTSNLKGSYINYVIQGVPKKKGNRSSKVNYFKNTQFNLVNYALE